MRKGEWKETVDLCYAGIIFHACTFCSTITKEKETFTLKFLYFLKWVQNGSFVGLFGIEYLFINSSTCFPQTRTITLSV
jgi:hypothetical protein